MKKRKGKARPEAPKPSKEDRFAGDGRDVTLVLRAKADDAAAFREIVERYKKPVAGLAFKMVGDYDDAKDIAQLVFVKLYHHIKEFDTRKKFSTWLFQIAVNTSIDFWRRSRKFRHEEIDEKVENRADDNEETPEAVYMRKEEAEKVRASIASLSPRQRTIFVLCDLEGLHISDAAAIVNLPRTVTRWHLHKARARLRTELLKEIRPPDRLKEPPGGKKVA